MAYLPEKEPLLAPPSPQPPSTVFQALSSPWWQRKCGKGFVTIRISAVLLLSTLLLTSCATQHSSQAGLTRFYEQEQANLVVRYYSDETSYVLKPEKMDGPFLSILDKSAVLAVAKQQPGRELAVVILIHYADADQATSVKHEWKNLLTDVGYQRVVFLRGLNGMRVNGLQVLASRN